MLYGDDPVKFGGVYVPAIAAMLQSGNLYVYCMNNPLLYFDSDGAFALSNKAKVIIGAVALTAAVALTVATGGGAAVVATGVAKVVGSVALSTAVSAGLGYLENGKQGAIDGAANGFMFASLSAVGGAAVKYAKAAKAAKAAKGIGNPVDIVGKGSTGRTISNTLNEQMAMHQVRANPLENATKLPIEMKDLRWPSSEGWVKMQSVVENSDKTKTTIHFLYNELTGAFDDFKFK